MPQVLVLAGHGSRDEAGAEELLALAGRVRARGEVPVEAGFIELSPPPLSEALAAAAGQAGPGGEVVVVPVVLLGAGHAKTDIPASVVAARDRYAGVGFVYGSPLGVDPELLDLGADRLEAAVAPDLRASTAVLVVGRGTGDPDANGDLSKIARLLWEGRSWPLAEAAFVGITEPRVPEGLERLRRLGAERIVVLPWFLFTGVLERRIHDQAAGFAAATGVAVTVAGYFGPDDRVADLVLRRHREARQGVVRRNCDLCVFRAPVQGFEAMAGAPLRPHYHPDDPSTHGHHHDHPHG
jgi:sirohydrochlorin cobaltochelatase